MEPTRNTPEDWRDGLRAPQESDHKYSRGHVVVLGGEQAVGAAKLASLAALRAGAGAASIVTSEQSFPIYAAWAEAVMVKPVWTDAATLRAWLAESKPIALVAGCGLGVSARTKEAMEVCVKSAHPLVMDADGLNVWDAEALSARLKDRAAPTVLTPHAAEFMRLFGGVLDTDAQRIEQVQRAAKLTGAVVLLKGHHTLIASPEGKLVVNDNAPAYLATAGSGDVLSGVIAALLAQGMDAFEATCAAAWLHGAAGQHCGSGLIAEDLPDAIRHEKNAFQNR